VQQFSGDYGFQCYPGGFLYKRDNSYEFNCNASSAPTLNAWHHWAVSRNNTTVSFWLDGVRKNSVTIIGSLSMYSSVIVLGDFGVGPGVGNGGQYRSNYVGYIKDFRLVVGSNVYNVSATSITVPTSTLTSITNTKLLTCQSSRFTDNGSYSINVLNGIGSSYRVTNFNPFGITNTGTSGSMYFDGSGDYLSVPSNAAFNLSTYAFCVETWFYPTAATGQILTWSLPTTGIEINLSSGTVTLDLGSGSSWFITGANCGSAALNAWNHIAIVKNSSGNIGAFLNKNRNYSTTNTTAIGNANTFVSIGANRGSSNYFTGYFSNIRYVNGSEVYDPTQASLTIPTAPLTAIANTSLLTLQNKQPHNNHSFQDSSSHCHLITRSGNTTQGTFSPFSQTGWSNYFNGSDAYLSYTQSGSTFPNQLSFLNGASGSGTIECWVYVSSSSQGSDVADFPPFIAVGNTYFSIGVTTTKKLRFYWWTGTTNYLDSTGTVNFNTWTHIAAVRNAAIITIYIDGAVSGSISYTGWSWASSAGGTSLYIAYSAPNVTSRYFNGYISNLRIVKDQAVYTGNFTPATSALTANTVGSTGAGAAASITGTVSLLTCQSNRFVDNSSNNFALTVSGTPSVQAFSPFAPTAVYSPAVHGGSGYFDGSDYLSIASNALWNLDGNFTVECWAYFTSFSNNRMIMVAVNNAFGLYCTDSGFPLIDRYGVAPFLTSNTAMALNSWNHIAAVRSGSSMTLYLNGLSVGTLTSSHNFVQGPLFIGYDNYAFFHNGFMSNIRIVKGVAVYTGNFTPPTAPLTAIANTSLLLNFTDAAITDATARNVLETVGDARISTAQSKWTGGSMSFDGSGDYLVIPSSEFFTLRTADFTVELWVYFVNFNTQQILGTQTTQSSTSWQLYVQANYLIFSNWATTAVLYATSNLSTYNWYHIAVTRQSGTFRLFVNGQLVNANTPVAQDYSSTQTLYIGDDVVHTGTGAFTGYMNDIRITKGYARYTANFTPPSGSFRLK
jgi:hypothetical protein